jgi:acyl carrier protein
MSSLLDNFISADTIGLIIRATKERTGMTEQEVFEKIKGIIVELLGVDVAKVTPEARFREDLEADSLDLVELIMAFEEEFNEEIPDEDAQKITTVGGAVSYIMERAKAKGAA